MPHASLLHERFEAAGAEFQPYGDVPIVSTFGYPELEYAALHKTVGLMDLPQRAVVELTGADRHVFLNNLLTNELVGRETKAPLAPGSGVYSFFLTRQGRIFCDMDVVERPERTLLHVDRRVRDALVAELGKYLFTEKVAVRKLDDVHLVALHGPAAASTLNSLLEAPIEQLAPLASAAGRMLGAEVSVWRDDLTPFCGLFLLLPIDRAQDLWRHILTLGGSIEEPLGPDELAKTDPAARPAQFARRAIRPVGWAAFNATRIEAGHPLFGIDFDESALPAETGLLERAVNFNKGCYLGQEIVARMHARNVVARQIVGFSMESDALPFAGARVHDDVQNEVGAVTSSTLSPALSNVAIGLASVKRAFTAIGTVLKVPAEGEMRSAKVVETPFIKSTV